MKSKFNMTSRLQQIKQTQKFYIECEDKVLTPPKNLDDRVATQLIKTMTHMSPTEISRNTNTMMSDLTKSFKDKSPHKDHERVRSSANGTSQPLS